MDILIEILVEFFFEVFGEGFVYLRSAFIPNKDISPKAQRRIGAVCLVVCLVLLVGLLVGIVILIDTQARSFWGWLLIGLNVIYVVSGIILKIVSHLRNK